jgi:hypothetical protein
MIRDTRPQDATGMNRVGTIVQGRSGHGWQPYDHINDNGVDGIIIKRKHGVDTGEIIFVQVKCGSGNGYFKATKNRPKYFGVNVGKDYITTHRPRWNKLFGPIILVYVDFKSEKAWWTDLKNDNSFTPENNSIILVPKHQRFGEHSFGNFNSLKGFLHIDPELTEIKLDTDDISYYDFTKTTIKNSAKCFYKKWATSNERNNPTLGEIIVSREGWRHISRKGRKPERIIQSWNLLGVAKKIIQTVEKAYQLRQYKSMKDKLGNYLITDYISLRAQVLFPQRHSSVIQVILIRKRKFSSTDDLLENKIRFLSVYEPMNGKKIR